MSDLRKGGQTHPPGLLLWFWSRWGDVRVDCVGRSEQRCCLAAPPAIILEPTSVEEYGSRDLRFFPRGRPFFFTGWTVVFASAKRARGLLAIIFVFNCSIAKAESFDENFQQPFGHTANTAIAL